MQIPAPDVETDAKPSERHARVAHSAPWTGGFVDDSSPYPGRKLGQILVEAGALLPANLDHALALQKSGQSGPLGTILLDEHMVDEDALDCALALQKGVLHVDIPADAGDPAGIDALGPDTCLRLGLVPLATAPGDGQIVATARPDLFGARRASIEAALGPCQMAITTEDRVIGAVLHRHSDKLTQLAEARPPPEASLRGWTRARMAAVVLPLLALLSLALILAPQPVVTGLLALAICALTGMSGLRLAALVSALRAARTDPPLQDEPEIILPRISLIIALLRESSISDHLLAHLSALDYPADRLDIVFATEAEDRATTSALQSALPANARIVEVPPGTLQTKPRALNYALDFARGDIIGVLDAEDAPEPAQLRVIARHFARTAPKVACLQGRLDFYNPAQNWLARCFAIDYAAWFRVFLPGLARLGFAIPLGGTTVYFRRGVLEHVGRWDAHNVTEDADLGIRLARAGYRTEIAATATGEEANCHLPAWVRQRARWLKGYALTWAVNMRHPLRLWRDLGPRQFLGFQIMFLGTTLLFLLAPVLWSFWLIPFGITHPLEPFVPRSLMIALALFFVASEALSWVAEAVALRAREDRWLIPWIPTTMLYFPLASLASYRALLEIASSPFYWHKTRHGISPGLPVKPRLPRPRHSGADGSRRHG